MINSSHAETASTSEESSLIRLNKFIARAGITSRRKADSLIQQGKVCVNGEVCTEMGIRINQAKDTITVNGITIEKLPELKYYALNKPKGYICATKSMFGDKLITELLPPIQLSTIGRLDKNTTGLIIATNDGELVNQIAHPTYTCEKEYMIKVRGEISDTQIEQLKKGVEIEVEKVHNGHRSKETHFAKPKDVTIAKRRPERSVVLITIHEGKKRQVRLMMKAIGYSYIELKRVRIKKLKLGNLEIGKWKKLTPEEIQDLKS